MFIMVSRHGRRRSAVESLIRQLYGTRYRAIPSFTSTLVAELDHAGHVECAAGIRFSKEPFFSECFLDRPIEDVLRTRLGRNVHRDQIVEVCHLAGNKPGGSLPSSRRLSIYCGAWTANGRSSPQLNRCGLLLRRNRLAMVELGLADRRRVPDPDNWGSYFEHDPRIMAVSHSTAFGSRHFPVFCSVTPSDTDARIF